MPLIAERPDILNELEIERPPLKGEGGRVPWRMLLRSWLQTAVITAALFFLITRFAVQGFAVSGSCMEPNLHTGERILGNKFVYTVARPARGDVIVFRYPLDPSKTYIKRVIALPGETICILSGRVFIDGRELPEPYVVNSPHGDFGPEKVGPGRLFVMGDYRDESNDSRAWGEVPISNVKAKAWVRYWPPRVAEVVR
jgi:signal peptidase I